jgi:hypothetical protein
MKTIFNAFYFLVILCTSLSCSKDDGFNEDPNEQGLTGCPIDSYCAYFYDDNVDFSNVYDTNAKGNSRVFWSKLSSSSDRYTKVFLKTPMTGSTFYIDNSAIQKGVVKFDNNCPACYSAPVNYKVTGGYSKGKKLNSQDASGKDKWLVETKLFYRIEGSDFKDSAFVKQYYYLSPYRGI